MPTVLLPQAGAQIYYALHRQRPSAPPLILVHGAGGSHLVWPSELRRLPGSTVYAVDLPGHGRSPRSAHGTIPAYAEIIAEFVEALALEGAVLLGFSMGGAVALQAALYDASRLAGLILISTASSLPVPESLLNHLEQDYEGAVERLSHLLFHDQSLAQLGHRFLLGTDPEVVYQDFAACRHFNLLAPLSDLLLPTQILGSQADKMVPAVWIAALADQIKDSEIHWIQNTGHMVILEQPAVVAGTVQAFLRSVQ